MSITPLKTKSAYLKALAFIEKHFDAKPNSSTGEMIEVLSILVEKYEDEHFPIDLPSPVEAIKFRMEQLGMSNADLAKILGTKSRVSEILNKKRPLSIKMIRIVRKELGIPAEILIAA